MGVDVREQNIVDFILGRHELGQPAAGEQIAGVGYSASEGKDDICRYISDKGWVAGNWRMPTADEYTKLYNERTTTVTIGAYTNETIGGSNPSLYSISSGRWLGAGAVDSSTANMQTPPNATVFLPAAGYRLDSNGALGNPGGNGCYWSASPGSGSGGYGLVLNSSGIYPAGNSNLANGFAVRCIRE